MTNRRIVRWSSIISLVVCLLMLCIPSSHGSMTRLRQQIELAEASDRSDSNGRHPHSNSPDVARTVGSVIDSTALIHGLQQQVSSVTASLDSFLNAHSGDSQARELDHAQIEHILTTLQSLAASQKEIEERNSRQIEQDHANLLQLIDTQKKQQALLTQELEHSKSLEAQLALLKQEQEATANQHMAAQELESANLEHEIAQQQHMQQMQPDSYEDTGFDGSFIEMAAQRPSSHLQVNEQVHHADDDYAYLEHDVDLSHTMDHSMVSALEMHDSLDHQNEHRLGLAAASGAEHEAGAGGHMDPTRYSSSADYLAAMNSAEDAENMSPKQLEAFGASFGLHSDSEHEVGTPSHRALHSLSEIDSLVAEGAEENHQPFEFDPSKLHNPSLAQGLESLQSEDSIQTAMLHVQARIKAIAAELEKHQQANGNTMPHDGLEIDVSFNEPGSDELHY